MTSVTRVFHHCPQVSVNFSNIPSTFGCETGMETPWINRPSWVPTRDNPNFTRQLVERCGHGMDSQMPADLQNNQVLHSPQALQLLTTFDQHPLWRK